jgi:prevent-host-death family protein
MTSVGVRELKARLSAYLGLAASGETVLVTEHGRPIARLTPLAGDTVLEEWIEAGIATRPSTRRPLPKPLRAKGTVSDLVADERR